MTVQQTARECPFAGALAERLRLSKRDLVLHWLERISERVSIERERVFPTSDLLDHVPLLVDGIADYLENPSVAIGSDTPVVGKAMELGALRHKQGFDAYEILKEYEILGGILFSYLAHAADEMDEPCEKSELLVCGHRLFQAIAIIQQTTTMHFLRLAEERVAEREGRLRAFNRAISHEIKNHVGAIMGAGDTLISVPTLTDQERERFYQMVVRNSQDMRATLDNLVALARLEGDARQHRHIRLLEAAKEVTRQLRESARAAGVAVRLGELPNVEVNAAAVELSLTNYVSNAIKYADAARDGRWVQIEGHLDDKAQKLEIRVSDNGLGVPADKRAKLFDRFFRAHETVTEAEGTGLGLSIVRETVESIGGTAWAEFPEQGSVFVLSLPYRRSGVERRSIGTGH